MEIDLIALLQTRFAFALFMVVGCGYLLGNLQIGSFKIGPTSGVLVAGLAFGWLGVPVAEEVVQLGFILFIFSVGLQAGPRFFSVFMEDGKKYLLIAVLAAVTSLCTSILMTFLLDLPHGYDGGLLAGSLTSTPTLAAARDAVYQGIARMDPGLTREDLANRVSTAYAITYLFGAIGLMFFVRVVPKWFGIDLKGEAKALAKNRPFTDEEDEGHRHWSPIIRAYKVTKPEFTGKGLAEVGFRRRTQCIILKIKRNGVLFDPAPDTVLTKGDRVSVLGRFEAHDIIRRKLGQEVLDADLRSVDVETLEVVVTERNVIGRPLNDLHLISQHGCFISDLSRSHVPLPVEADLVLQRGDIMHIAGPADRVESLAKQLGHVETSIFETDLVTFALGITAGLLLGTLALKVGTLSITLGSAGGLLFTGILIGFVRSEYPTFGRVPRAARWLLRELGLMLFMAGIGMRTGPAILDALLAVGPQLMLAGVAVTLMPLIICFSVGRFALKMNPILLLGALAGAMTSTPALNTLTSEARSSLPGLGYAGTYAFANLLLALAGTLIMML